MTQIAIGLCAAIKVCELVAATSELVMDAVTEALPDTQLGTVAVSFLAGLGCLWAAAIVSVASKEVAQQGDATMSPVGCPPPTFT